LPDEKAIDTGVAAHVMFAVEMLGSAV
jgi:hypothetical protein